MIFALSSAAYLVLLLLFWFGLGRAFSRWLTAGRAAPVSQHALHGFALATLAATIGYRWGLPLTVIFRFCLGGALVGYALHWRQLVSRRSTVPVANGRNDLLLLAAGAAILFTPLAIGGLQFALFHSNQYDALNYLQSAVVRLSYSYQEINTAGPAEFVQNPLLVIAHWMASIRPAIVDSFALTDGLSPGNLHQLSPAFLIGIQLLAIPALARIAARLGASPLRAGLIGLAAVGGFWGQYLLDCDTWSLVGALPLALAAFHALDELLDPASTARPPAVGIAVLFAALLLVYPEQFCFLAPAVGAFVLWHRRRCRGTGVDTILLKTFAGTLLLAAPYGVTLWAFVERQLHSTIHADYAPLAWSWTVLFGPAPQTAPIWQTVWQTFAGVFGIYLQWLTPASATIPNLSFILAGMLGLGVMVASAFATSRVLKQPNTRTGMLHLLAFAAVLLVQIIALGFLKGPWPAAKALSYSFPWIMMLALLPLALPGRLSWMRWPAGLLLGLQLVLALARPFAAAAENGVGYTEPYPNADPAMKIARNWDANTSPHILAGSHRVRIDVPDLWLESYAMICAQAQGRPFVKTTPIHEYYDMTPKNFGLQDVTAGTDGLIFADYDRQAHTMALAFAVGGNLRWSGERPISIARINSPAPLESWQGLLSWWGSATLEVHAKKSGTAFLELLVRRHPALPDGDHPTLNIEVNGQPVFTENIGTMQAGSLRVIGVSANLTPGRNVVTIKTDAAGAASPTLGFSNPRYILRAAPELPPAP